MTVLQITILSIVCLMCILSVLLFYFQKKKEQEIHLQAVGVLKNDIAKNKHQIKVRQTCLGNYNFIRQNLNEALCIQQEIDITC